MVQVCTQEGRKMRDGRRQIWWIASVIYCDIQYSSSSSPEQLNEWNSLRAVHVLSLYSNLDHICMWINHVIVWYDGRRHLSRAEHNSRSFHLPKCSGNSLEIEERQWKHLQSLSVIWEMNWVGNVEMSFIKSHVEAFRKLCMWIEN